MASEVKTNKVSPASGTTVTLGNSGDTVSLGSGATASGFLPSSISTSGDDFQFNSGYGSVATAYGCRAWVNFNGTGTVAIRDSGNVSSITDNGTGDYTVNLTTEMPDINYAPFISNSKNPDVDFVGINTNTATGLDVAPTTTTCRISFSTFGVGGKDPTYLSFAIFR